MVTVVNSSKLNALLDIVCPRDWSREVDGVASHPPWVLQLDTFLSKLLLDSISGAQIFKIFLGHPPKTIGQEHAEQDAECGLHNMWARPTLTKPYLKFWCYIIFIICIWKIQLSWNLSEPPTLFYFWINAWFHMHYRVYAYMFVCWKVARDYNRIKKSSSYIAIYPLFNQV